MNKFIKFFFILKFITVTIVLKTKNLINDLINHLQYYDLPMNGIEGSEILINACLQIKNVYGLTAEIGIREGGSSLLIMKTCLDNKDKRIHIGIDPFGNILYNHWENINERLDYTNRMRNKMLKNIYKFSFDFNLDFLFFCLEDIEFFEKFGNGIPVYEEEKK